ncbi:DMT family transporter [Filifactor villosus]|uniref:DMT family transporter n=1 Tax=Filifactor villosus TaxID=29374 RepID=A0ABV9QLS0_9FIRM
MSNKRWVSWFLLIFTCFAWGGSYVSIEICLRALGPAYLPFFRYLISSVILFVALKLGKSPLYLEKKDLGRIILSALASITFYFYFENVGIMKIGANEAAVLVAMMPIIALVANRIFLKQKILLRNIISSLISIAGIYLVIGGAEFNSNYVGYLYMMMASISWVTYMICTKPLVQKYDGLLITFYQCLIGTVGFIPMLKTDYVYIERIDLPIMLHFLFLALICSAACTWFYAISIKELGVSISAMLLNFIPVATFIFSFVFLNEVLAPMKLLGSAIAIGGLLMMKGDEAVEEAA